METASTSEASVNFYQTARRDNTEDRQLHTHRRENLKSHKYYFNCITQSQPWVLVLRKFPPACHRLFYPPRKSGKFDDRNVWPCEIKTGEENTGITAENIFLVYS
jgi:hypothetical protein